MVGLVRSKRLTGYEYGRQIFVLERGVERPTLYPFFVFLHAMPGGGPVLKGQSSWRTVCGVYLSRPTWRLQIQFRRFSVAREVPRWMPQWLRCSYTSTSWDYDGLHRARPITVRCLRWRWHRPPHSTSVRRSK
jgi:hypothetical protein